MSPEDISKLIDELGTKLGPTGTYLFNTALQKNITTSLVWFTLGCILLFGGILILGTGWIRWRQYHARTGSKDATDYQLVMIVGGIGSALLGLIFFLLALPMVLNPQYYAVKDLIEMIPK